ncbi:hypothetical protein KIW84_UN0022 [Lathyrus oleraceus]|nr:hypothetical protein KIW84_UN0022 [Pisum sativum]
MSGNLNTMRNAKKIGHICSNEPRAMVKQWKPITTKERDKPLIEVVALEGSGEKWEQVKVCDNGDIVKIIEGKNKDYTVLNKLGLEKRRVLWKDIERISRQNQDLRCIVGDFNNVMSTHDIVGGNLVQKKEFIDLADMVVNIGLVEVESKWDWFIWSIKQSQCVIYSRIDKVLANLNWMQQHMDYVVHIMEPGIEDALKGVGYLKAHGLDGYGASGDLGSVQVGMEKIQEFSRSTGLVVNPIKCNVYFGGLDDKTKGDIMMVTGFKEGDLPFKYLGIPLTSKRLNNHQCVSLVEKITSRNRHRSPQFLSYAGRMQLIKSVLCATTIY